MCNKTINSKALRYCDDLLDFLRDQRDSTVSSNLSIQSKNKELKMVLDSLDFFNKPLYSLDSLLKNHCFDKYLAYKTLKKELNETKNYSDYSAKTDSINTLLNSCAFYQTAKLKEEQLSKLRYELRDEIEKLGEELTAKTDQLIEVIKNQKELFWREESALNFLKEKIKRI